jgi:putative ABC transport system substrate-binding protein
VEIGRLYNFLVLERWGRLFGGCKRHMKCLGSSIAIFFLISTTLLADIAIVKTAGSSQFDEVRNGFASICFENQREFSLQEDLSNQAQILEQIRAGNFNLIVSIGSQATTFAKSNLPDIQLLYSVVAFPERMGLTGEKIAGIPLQVPFEQEFGMIRDISKKIKRIGVLYTRPFNEPLIQEVRPKAEARGLTLISSPLGSSRDIERAMNNLVGKCDIIWIPPDPSLESDETIKYIGATSLSKQIPCVGSSERYVKAGAIFSMAVDAVEIGRMAGDLANKITQGKSPGTLSIQNSNKPRFIINIRTANILRLAIPKNIQDKANKVYQ